ncbi:MAG: hypothetical protein A2Y12_17690 [Planctomycetes bacterium GWF2_42_9]|nr:MAG: hypothetical protein A2Y12_17690 [Planctomycetes bacterium GWF2_42_9]
MLVDKESIMKPRTEELNKNLAGSLRKNVITARVIFDPVWMPRIHPDPLVNTADLKLQADEARKFEHQNRCELEVLGSDILELVDKFNSEFGSAIPVRSNSIENPRWGWSRFGDFDMLSMSLGGPQPIWDKRNGCYWPSNRGILSWVKSVSDVGRIPTPNWYAQPAFIRMLKSRQRWYEAFPDNPPGNIAGGVWNQPEGRNAARFVSYMSFIDIGPHLFGADEFMMILASDPELAEALMEKFFELSISFGNSMQALCGGKPECIVGFGGDYACMLSPELYEKYSIGWDIKLFEHFREFYASCDGTPCNLHSCGPSPHLYPAWKSHPAVKNITTMQTRLLPECVKTLRQTLPNTQIQLTFHPEHFDFANVSSEELRTVFCQAVEDAGCAKTEFVIFAIANAPDDIARLETNIRVIYDELFKING